MKRLIQLILISTLLGGPFALASNAPAKSWGLAADNSIFAQALVGEIMSDHAGMHTAGMHCVPPNHDALTIVASTLNVIGKPSDPPDIDVYEHDATRIAANLAVPKVGVMLPLMDRSGKTVGALALAFKYHPAKDQVAYLTEAIAIRDGLSSRIPNHASLFRSTR